MRPLHHLAIVLAFAAVATAACGAFGGNDRSGDDIHDVDGGSTSSTDSGVSVDAYAPVSADAGAKDSGTASVDAAPIGFGKRVFVSTSLFGAGAGSSGANALCIADARDAGLAAADEFVGWLSAGQSPNPLDKLAVGDGWGLMDGTPVFRSKDAIYTEGPLHAIDMTVRGDKVVTSGVWTGVYTDGGGRVLQQLVELRPQHPGRHRRRAARPAMDGSPGHGWLRQEVPDLLLPEVRGATARRRRRPGRTRAGY